MRLWKIFAGITLFSFPEISFAAEPLPPEMMYQGKPINSECFYHLISPFLASGQKEKIDLNDCSRPDDRNSGVVSTYKYLGKIGGALVVELHFSSDTGTAHMNSVQEIERKGNTLKLLKQIASENHNYNYITDAKVVDGRLFYNKQLGCDDMFAMAHVDDDTVGGDLFYGDCGGVIHYEGETPVTVSLLGDSAWQFGVPEKPWTPGMTVEIVKARAGAYKEAGLEYLPRQCFSELSSDYVVHGKATLTVEELKEFVHIFLDVCFEPRTKEN